MHYLKRKTIGNEGVMAVKLDISKAYNRVEWNFLQAILCRLGFHTHWISLVMACVFSVQYQIAHGGMEFGSIVSTRGLRQGDPLSPYLFILCAEGLSALINNYERRGRLRDCRVANGAPRISHMFFADDSYVFCRATVSEANNVLELLGIFEKASGQKVNLEKSSVFFSRNTEAETRRNVCYRMTMLEASDDSTYLGLPNILGRKKSVILGFLKDRISKKIQNWDSKMLSCAGKEILIKTVAQALPNYAMSVFLMPGEVCKDMERLMCRFWWRTSPQKEKGIHWMSWERMCKPRGNGGLGFRCLRNFNISLLGKQGWRLAVQPDSLVSKVFKARYYPGGAKLGPNPSYVWRSIFEAQELVRKGIGWRVRSGKQVNVLNEPWLLNEANPFVVSRHPALVGCKVTNLMIERSGEWDKDVVCELFNEVEVAAILAMPLPREGGVDNLYWRYEKNGFYSVKSAYKLLSQSAGSGVEVTDSKFWRKLWKSKVPPKLKNMVWRAAANCLPTKVPLRGKYVEIDTTCAQCRVERETTMHCLVLCPFAEACWSAAGFVFFYYDGATFAGWLKALFQRIDDDGVRRAMMLCWALWRARNELVWKNSGTLANQVVVAAKFELDQWNHAKERGLIPSFTPPIYGDGVEHWSKSVGNMIKVNVDATIFNDSGRFGVGCVARGADGLIIEAMVLNKGGPVSPGVAEAIGVREALSWIKKKGWKEVIVETDCLVVAQSVRSEIVMLSYYGSIIAECRELLKELNCVPLIFVKRSANRVAHYLARASYSLSDRIFRSGSVLSDIHAPYDTSASINPPCLSAANASSPPPSVLLPRVGSAIERSIVWDSVYFTRIAECGYEYEQTYAFLPLLPLCVSVFSKSVFAPLVPLIGYRAVLGLSGYVINNVAFVFAALYLYWLSVIVLKEEEVALRASILFCVNPASIFYSSIYSESLYALLSFGGLYHFMNGKHSYATLWRALSGCARSNGVLNAGYICYHAMQRLNKAFSSRNRSYLLSAKILLAGALRSLFVFAPFVSFQAYGYLNICIGRSVAEMMPWCKARLPLLYNYIQSHYWGVGFLRYFQLKQLLNFLLASPILSLALCSIVYYVKLWPEVFLSLGLRVPLVECKLVGSSFSTSPEGQTSPTDTSNVLQDDGALRLRKKSVRREHLVTQPSKSEAPYRLQCDPVVILPFVLHLSFMVATAFFVMHVQVSTRFLSASPLLYWFASHIMGSPRIGKRWGRFIWAYSAVYIFTGSLLFSNFYPFT